MASTRMIEVAYIDQMNSGKRIHVMPGARRVCTVAMILTPVKIDENPAMNTPQITATTWPLLNIVDNGV